MVAVVEEVGDVAVAAALFHDYDQMNEMLRMEVH